MKSNSLLDLDHKLTPSPTAIIAAVADELARSTVFAEYQAKKAASTLAGQQRHLDLFAKILNDSGAQIDSKQLFADPEAWKEITFGLVTAFKLALVNAGYALTTINVYLSTVKTYVKLAYKAGSIIEGNYHLIREIQGFSGREATNVDAKREVTRLSNEKTEPILIPLEVMATAKSAKFYPDTPIGKRDRFIMCLLLDHALRASEISDLKLYNVDKRDWTLRFYRRKTDSDEILNMSADTIKAYTAYIDEHPTIKAGSLKKDFPLIVSGRKGGELKTSDDGPKAVHRVNITDLVRRIGKRLAGKQFGVEQLRRLSAHDGRHTWATYATDAGTPINIVMSAGGWSNPAMAIKYSVKKKIANEGVKLPY